MLYLPLLITLLVPMSAPARDRMQRYAPMTAGLAVQATSPDPAFPGAPWPGLATLAGYSAAAAAGGVLAISRRDA